MTQFCFVQMFAAKTMVWGDVLFLRKANFPWAYFKAMVLPLVFRRA